MSEQEKKRQRIYDLLNAGTKPIFLCLPYTKQWTLFFSEKEIFKEKRGGVLNNKRKEGVLTGFSTTIMKDLATPIRKHPHEFKVHEKTVRTASK